MLRTSVLALISFGLCASPAPLLSAGPETSEDRYQFHVSIDMVSLSVTALDHRGRLVTDLEEDDFTVYEDGVEQELSAFTREDLPLRMVILLDTSGSMLPRMRLAQEAAIQFVRSLKPEDLVSVIEFNDRVLTLKDFTSDFDEVAEAIAHTAASGATSLYNALYVALRSLPQRREGVERHAIVALSDGDDNRSLVSFEDVRAVARRTDVSIFGVGLLGSKEWKDETDLNVIYVLKKLAEDTGGAAFLPETIDDLAGVYDRIAADLKSQYNLGYVSNADGSPGTWRRIQVLSSRDGVQARTRSGYYTPGASSSRRSRPE